MSESRAVDTGTAERAMCTDSHGHPGHIWYARNGRPCWCTGVNVARWYNAVVEQQGRDRQAEQ